MKSFYLLSTLSLAGISLLSAQQEINRAQLAIFGQLPQMFENPANACTEEKVDLGRKLFYDTRLSKSQQISCNSCHGLDTYGVDGKAFSEGHAGHLTGRNSPTVYNAAGHISQFWDGRAADVEEQAKGPVLAGGEMAMPSPEFVVEVLKSIPGYVEEFGQAFPEDEDPITYDNMAAAIGAFERYLVTPSRFDDYLAGNEEALSDQEKAGLHSFITVGCTSCHMGPMLGGMLYQKLGLVKPWPYLTDFGRHDATGVETDKHFFKTPSLRNVEMTAPYLHDGSISSLPLMVAMMAEHQLGRTLTQDEVENITAFLQSLTGEIDEDYIKKPELPKSGPNTPKPSFD